MKIRMKDQISGARNGVRWPPAGETKELPEAEALDLIKAGLAEPVKAEAETRPAPAPETAAKKTTRKR